MVIDEGYKKDIEVIQKILKESDVKEMYLFGSVAEGRQRGGSDIDVAVRGVSKSNFFGLYGKLLSETEHSVDLVCLDYSSQFTEYLISSGGLVRVF